MMHGDGILLCRVYLKKHDRLRVAGVTARRVFEAVLWILHTGAQWSLSVAR